MFRIIGYLITFIFAYRLGKNRSLDITKSYILSKTSNLGQNVGQTEYIKVNPDGTISFVNDMQDASAFSYSTANQLHSVLMKNISLNSPYKINITNPLLS